MSNEALLEMLRSLKQDIRDLRVEVRDVTNGHSDKLDDLSAFRWKWVGAFSAIALILEIMMKLVEHVIQ